MQLNARHKKSIIEIIILIFILLFVYAAVNKLLDFKNFQTQLGQSPVLSPFAEWIVWLIPTLEIAASIFLFLPKYRTLGLISALSLMVMFSVYIFIILHFGSFVPCSCGGILEKMNWRQHFIFNLFFVLLAAVAFALNYSLSSANRKNSKSKTFFITAAVTALSSITVIVLFRYSEKEMHYENPFIRRYPKHPVSLEKSLDLVYNSFYFAGYSNNRIYLGNYTNPLHIISLDTILEDRRDEKIKFSRRNIPFRMIRIMVQGSNFYMSDGSVPCIFKGEVSDWKIIAELAGIRKFNLAVPITDSLIAVRSTRGSDAYHILGVVRFGDSIRTVYNKGLLRKQPDGIFGTDGILMGSEKNKEIVYLHYYKNQFLIADKNAKKIGEGKTIDTITKAQIKVAHLKGGLEKKMSSTPLVVNDLAAVYGDVLFVKSKIQGRFEKKKLWQQASIIDVYNYRKNKYIMSFAIYEIGNEKLESFYVTPHYLFAIQGTQLTVYKFDEILLKEMNTSDI